MNFHLTVRAAQLKQAITLISRLKVVKHSMASSLLHLRIEETKAHLISVFDNMQIDTPLAFAGPSGGGHIICGRKSLAEIAKLADRNTSVTFAKKSKTLPNGGISTHVAATFTSKGFATSRVLQTYQDKDAFNTLAAVGRRLPLSSTNLANLRLSAKTSSRDETRAVINGTCLDPVGTGALISTDGRRLFHAPCRAPSHRVIIPNQVLDIISHKLLHSGALLTYGEPTPDRLLPLYSLAFGSVATVTFRGIEGNFPNYLQVIPDPALYAGTIAFTPATAQRVLTWLRTARHHTLHIEHTATTVRLSRFPTAEKDRTTDDTETIIAPAGILGKPPAQVGFNTDFFADALEMGFTNLNLIDSISPGVFSSPDARYVLMPMRIVGTVTTPDDDEENEQEAATTKSYATN